MTYYIKKRMPCMEGRNLWLQSPPEAERGARVLHSLV